MMRFCVLSNVKCNRTWTLLMASSLFITHCSKAIEWNDVSIRCFAHYIARDYCVGCNWPLQMHLLHYGEMWNAFAGISFSLSLSLSAMFLVRHFCSPLLWHHCVSFRYMAYPDTVKWNFTNLMRCCCANASIEYPCMYIIIYIKKQLLSWRRVTRISINWRGREHSNRPRSINGSRMGIAIKQNHSYFSTLENDDFGDSKVSIHLLKQ